MRLGAARAAALAALFYIFSANTYAAEAVDLWANSAQSVVGQTIKTQPTFRVVNTVGNVTYIKRNVDVAMSGNPMKWVKGAALTAGVTAAVAGAGYVIDELTNQITSVSTPTVTDFTQGQYYGSAADGNFASLQTQGYLDSVLPTCGAMFGTACRVHSYETLPDKTKVFFDVQKSNGDWYNQAITVREYIHYTCTGGEAYCPAVAPATGGEPVETPVSDAVAWPIVAAVMAANPRNMMDVLQDNLGNPYVWPELAAEQQAVAADYAPNAPAYAPGIIADIDNLAAPERAVGTEPLAEPIEIPDDYAREETLAQSNTWLEQIKDLLNPDDVVLDDTQPALDEYGTVESDVSNTTAVLGDLPALPVLNGGGQCPTFTLDLPLSTDQIVLDAHCDFFTNKLNPLINFLIYCAAGLYLVRLYREETTRPIA